MFVPIIIDLLDLDGAGAVDLFDPHPQDRLVDVDGRQASGKS
jgi:hypothetical protein